MRNHRVALVVSTFGAAALAAALIVTYPGAAASQHTEDTAWRTAVIPSGPEPRAMLLTPQSLEPLAVFASAVEAWQFSTYVNDELAAARAAQERATIPTAPSTVATSPSGNAAIWACIIQHESGGDPTVYNHSGSGASGLYQFMPGTWNGYDGYANAADAPASVQTQYAYSYEAQNGWSAWVGDGCTPLG